MFSRSYLSLILGAALTSAAVNAAEQPHWYAGVQAGWSKHQHVGPVKSGDKEDFAAGLLIGHQFNSMFAVEGAYQYLGENVFAPDYEARTVQFAALARVGFPVTNQLYPYVKAGASAWITDVDGSDNADGISPVIGTGIAYKLSKHADVLLDYQFTADMADNVAYEHHADNHAVTVGFNWRFGKDEKPAPVVVPPVVEEAPVVVKPVEPPKQPIVLSGANAETMFANNSAKLQDTRALDPIVEKMKAHPEYKATIIGYTDSMGSVDYNVKLSEQRAISTAYYLISRGIDASRIDGKGMGPANPVADNSTAAGRAANRRVEITLSAE